MKGKQPTVHRWIIWRSLRLPSPTKERWYNFS